MERHRHVSSHVQNELSSDNRLIEVAMAVKAMTPSARQELLQTARKSYKRTWAEIGKIDPSGQTDAGQTAERRIAEAIVDLASRLASMPEASLRKLYK